MCWAWGPYWASGPHTWGWWWIFPVIGFAFMIFMALTCFGFFHGNGCMRSPGRFGRRRYDESEYMTREDELIEKFRQLERNGG